MGGIFGHTGRASVAHESDVALDWKIPRARVCSDDAPFRMVVQGRTGRRHALPGLVVALTEPSPNRDTLTPFIQPDGPHDHR